MDDAALEKLKQDLLDAWKTRTPGVFSLPVYRAAHAFLIAEDPENRSLVARAIAKPECTYKSSYSGKILHIDPDEFLQECISSEENWREDPEIKAWLKSGGPYPD